MVATLSTESLTTNRSHPTEVKPICLLDRMAPSSETSTVRVLCQKLLLSGDHPGTLQWLIGSPFFPPFTVVSTFRCIHQSPDFEQESDDLRKLLPKGFEVIGGLIVGDSDAEKSAFEAVRAARRLRKHLSEGGELDDEKIVGASFDSSTRTFHFFISKTENATKLEPVASVVYEDKSGNYIWETGCLLHCELPIKLPFYFPASSPSDSKQMFSDAIDEVITQFKEPNVAYIVETLKKSSRDAPKPVVFRGKDFGFGADASNINRLPAVDKVSDIKMLSCSHFFLNSKTDAAVVNSAENADKIQVSVLLNRSEKIPTFGAPVAEYFPAIEEARLIVVDLKLDVLAYALKDLPVMYAVSNLVIPALVDQLYSLKKIILPHLLMKHPQLHTYHFNPPGVLHPITTIYELNYGEMEMKQVDVRKSLHLRLGLPLDRPLLRAANALDLSVNDESKSNIKKRGSTLLKDVHIGIPSSGVSEGVTSLIQGSYEYYHYLQDGFDDSGWGCAYRSLQTIISWFRLQHYTSISVPSHREIQQTLVEIGDKDPSFIGSREWIGAIELSFVLDKLLGASCKIMNFRSGSELPEKCRELAMHFENQGTPIMIGGGVLAYTLLGVDYDEGSGDCAFLILDPHYTGSEDHKKIVNGGWCGWKKAVDSKGKRFFLDNKFYNLLLPQRPNMV